MRKMGTNKNKDMRMVALLTLAALLVLMLASVGTVSADSYSGANISTIGVVIYQHENNASRIIDAATVNRTVMFSVGTNVSVFNVTVFRQNAETGGGRTKIWNLDDDGNYGNTATAAGDFDGVNGSINMSIPINTYGEQGFWFNVSVNDGLANATYNVSRDLYVDSHGVNKSFVNVLGTSGTVRATIQADDTNATCRWSDTSQNYWAMPSAQPTTIERVGGGTSDHAFDVDLGTVAKGSIKTVYTDCRDANDNPSSGTLQVDVTKGGGSIVGIAAVAVAGEGQSQQVASQALGITSSSSNNGGWMLMGLFVVVGLVAVFMLVQVMGKAGRKRRR